MIKNVIITTLKSSEQRDERIKTITSICAETSLADNISVRIYRAQENDLILVEKWVFDTAEIRKTFTEADGIALGPWPEGNHDDTFGDLDMDSETIWEE